MTSDSTNRSQRCILPVDDDFDHLALCARWLGTAATTSTVPRAAPPPCSTRWGKPIGRQQLLDGLAESVT